MMISWDVPICVIKLSSQHANMTVDGLTKSKFSSGIITFSILAVFM